VAKPEGKSHVEYHGVDVRIIVKWIFKECDGGLELELSSSL
jgi:hypothetical protein